MRRPKITPEDALKALARESGLPPAFLDNVFRAISGAKDLAPSVPQTAEPATPPPVEEPPEVVLPADDLSPTMREALGRLAVTTVEVAPTNESRAKLRWFRTMGALAKRGYAMQDHDPGGDHAFLITRLGTARAMELGMVAKKHVAASGVAPKRTSSGTMKKVGT